MYERERIVEQWSDEPNLDALRAFAVLCVVARHLITWFGVADRPWMKAQALGLFGVLAFFVHTSLVLMVSLERQQRRRLGSRKSLYAAFVVRRLFRIYPLAIAAVLITYFLIVPLHDPDSWRAGVNMHATPATLVTNLLLIQDMTSTGDVLAPLWSLPAEVEMYLVLPLLFFLARARGTRGVLLGAWPVAVALALAAWKLDAGPAAARFAPCFVAGVVCYTLIGERRSLPFWMFPPTLVLALAAYMLAYARIGLQAGLGIPLTLGLAFALPLFEPMRAEWLRRASHAIAKYSYGVYLFHVPCIWLAFGKLGFLGVSGAALAFVVLLAAVSAAFYHLLESPMIRVGQRVAARFT